MPGRVGQNDVGPQCGARPTCWQNWFHVDPYWLIIHSDSSKLEPAPSDRTTGTMVWLGSLRPGLSAASAGSSQLVIWPVKILARLAPDSRRLVTRWPLMERLYMNT